MRKGQQTREMILRRAAQLFSCRGYFGSSLSDIMQATGLEKGGIYNHFEGKDDLAIQAFDYAASLMRRRLAAALHIETTARGRLLAHVQAFASEVEDPVLPGGCPLLNTAVEADDAHPALRERVREAMGRWCGSIAQHVREGIASGEIGPEVDAEAVATVLISTLEGALMLTKLYDDPAHMHRAARHLAEYIERQVCTGPAAHPAAATPV